MLSLVDTAAGSIGHQTTSRGVFFGQLITYAKVNVMALRDANRQAKDYTFLPAIIRFAS